MRRENLTVFQISNLWASYLIAALQKIWTVWWLIGVAACLWHVSAAKASYLRGLHADRPNYHDYHLVVHNLTLIKNRDATQRSGCGAKEQDHGAAEPCRCFGVVM